MGRIGFVFSGQGDQFPGMGRELCERYPAARAVFALCDSIRPGTSEMCFSGSEEDLKQTVNTQPCLFALELAAFAVLKEAGIHPDALAGFSLGEVAAMTAAGMVDIETGFRLVCKRGELMQRSAEKQETAMAAIVKLPSETVEALCAAHPGVYPVNYNCPGQISVAGLASELPAFSADVKAAGGRALSLMVKGAFHSPFMQEAAEGFAQVLSKTPLSPASAPLYSNRTAEPYGENAAELLAHQISSPVKWETLIRNMIAGGIDTFIEIGPGKTLTGMIGKIDPAVKRYAVCELDTLLSEVHPC